MQIIRAISIKNFRSIIKLDTPIETSDLNIMIGLNDSGKSNLLKALNLFFRGKTEINTDFRFEDDFCKYAVVPHGKAPEIEIAITFQLPPNYTKSGGLIVWKKTWRKSGFHAEKFQDEKGNIYKTEKTKSIAWLRKLKYYYVPAIRDEKYFNYLMGLVHDALSECNSKAFSQSSASFLSGIKKQVTSLVGDLSAITGMTSEIGMPSDFKLLFATLDFSLLTNNQHISITKRGDGIKAQHIPVILLFIAKTLKNRRDRQLNSDIIWGFEEPENNLEISKSFAMADFFANNSKSIQIFINTHSPAFYMLSQNKKINSKLYWVTRDGAGKTSYTLQDSFNISQINSDIGLMPIVAPYIQAKKEEEQKRIQLENKLSQVKNNQRKLIVFSEDEDLSYIDFLLKTNGFQQDDFKTISYHGRTNLKQALFSCKMTNFDESLVQYVVFHRDHDAYNGDEPDKNDIEKILKELNNSSKIKFQLFITQNYDIESYLINANHILECCKKIDPLTKIEFVEEIIQKATKIAEDESLEKMLDNKRYAAYTRVKMVRKVKEDYDANPTRWRYGKSVLKQIKNLLQTAFKKNIKLDIATDYLKINEFQDIQKRIV